MDEQFFTDPRTDEVLPQDETPATEEVVTDETLPDEVIEPSLEEETVEPEEEADEAEESDEDDPLAGAFQHYEPEAPKKKNWPIVLLAVLLVAVFVGGLLWAFGVFDKKDPEQNGTSENGGKDVSDLIAAESANFQFTNGMFSFSMETSYQDFQSQYSYYLPSFGLDTTKPLKDQAMQIGEGTWFDYFKTLTKNNAEWMLLFAEAAKKDGVTLDDATTAQLETYLESMEYSTLHNGVGEEDVRAFLEMYYTAMLHEQALYAGMHHSADAVLAKYNADPKAFDRCAYAYFTFSIGENGQFATKEAAADTVASLANAKTAEEFRKAVIAYLMTAELYESEDEAAKAYDANAVKTNATYSADDGISDWLFAADTAVGSTKTVENESTIAVYMLTKAPARDTTKTVNVRHILLTADTYGSDADAKAKADAVLAEWQAGDATAESFGALAAQYTEDSNGAQGGLYTGVSQGDMVAEFNDWCFDEARKVGDSGIVQTSYGYHVMYFDGAQEAWYTAVESALDEESYQAIYEQYKKDYPITFHDENIDQNDL